MEQKSVHQVLLYGPERHPEQDNREVESKMVLKQGHVVQTQRYVKSGQRPPGALGEIFQEIVLEEY